MRDVACVGALIRDARGRVYVHRRSADRRLLPGTWDIVGGHVESGETLEAALGREIHEETGWRLRRIEATFTDWEWTHEGVVRREKDYLVEVDGDLAAPVLEEGKHDACAWVGRKDLELLMVGRTDGDRRLRDIVAKAVRTRLTERLRLEPIGPEHADDLCRLHKDPALAEPWNPAQARQITSACQAAWERDGVHQWIGYTRDTGDLVGHGGLSRGEYGLEVGWAVSPVWGEAAAIEIGRAGISYGFEDLGANEIIALAPARDQAPMERLGLTYVDEVTPTDRSEPVALYRVRKSAVSASAG